jgi:hypothetical protein
MKEKDKLENQVTSSSFGQTKMGCGRIAGKISKIKGLAYLYKIQTKEGGVDHAFNPCGGGLGRSWRYSLSHQLIHSHGGLH